MRNYQRWGLVIMLTLIGSVAESLGDEKAGPREIFRHALIGLVPAITALKMSLDPKAER